MDEKVGKKCGTSHRRRDRKKPNKWNKTAKTIYPQTKCKDASHASHKQIGHIMSSHFTTIVEELQGVR